MPGSWEPLMAPWPLNCVHAVHHHSGKVLVWGFGQGSPGNFKTPAWLWDGTWNPGNPAAAFTDVSNDTTDLFCAGHCQLPNGRALVCGGAFFGLPGEPQYAPSDANVFLGVSSAASAAWREPPLSMAFRRYYPTCTTLPDGRQLITAGWQSLSITSAGASPAPGVPVTAGPRTRPARRQGVNAKYMEVFDPVAESFQTLPPERDQPLYPYMFVLPGGNLFDAGPGTFTIRLLAPPNVPEWAWDWGNHLNSPEAGLEHGSVCMFDAVLGRILKCGGSYTDLGEATDRATVVDFSAPSPAWTTNTPSMHFRRKNHNLVVLPDQTVLAIGGNRFFQSWGDGEGHVAADPLAVLEPEIFNPAAGPAGAWTRTFATMTDPRWYHSSATLLRDARVLVAGGNTDPNGPYKINSAQVFRPPYLDGNPARATIDSAPQFMGYGVHYSIAFTHPTPRAIARVALTRLGAATHGFDQDQRYVPLTFTPSPAGSLMARAPADGSIAPPGYYMLWLVDDLGVPCAQAAYVRVGAS